jgi:hypothetical protein
LGRIQQGQEQALRIHSGNMLAGGFHIGGAPKEVQRCADLAGTGMKLAQLKNNQDPTEH